MKREVVNPWDWSIKLGFDQGHIIEDAGRHLICSGQTAVDGEGSPQHIGDMRGQMKLALENLDAVLMAAGMGPRNVIQLRLYATDVDAMMQNLDILGQYFGPHDIRPPMTVLGVVRLALPEFMFEIEAVAVD